MFESIMLWSFLHPYCTTTNELDLSDLVWKQDPWSLMQLFVKTLLNHLNWIAGSLISSNTL
jgi:hypothetical protein